MKKILSYTITLVICLVSMVSFMGCDNRKKTITPDGLVLYGSEVYAIQSYLNDDEIIRIPDEYNGVPITEIGSYGVVGWFQIPITCKKLIFGKNITSAGFEIKGMELEAIEVDAENKHYRSVDGVLYTKDMENIKVSPPAINTDTFVVPSTVGSLDICAKYKYLQNLYCPALKYTTRLYYYIYHLDENNKDYEKEPIENLYIAESVYEQFIKDEHFIKMGKNIYSTPDYILEL